MLVHPLEPCQRRSGKAPSCTDVGQCGLLWKGTYCPLSPAQENPAQHNIAEGVERHLLIHSSAGHASNAGIISSALLGNHSTKKRRTWPWLHKLFHICLPQRCLLFFFLPPGRKVLIIYAHQEPKSLNGSLKRVAVEELSRQGCTVTVSDLYAMQFEPRATRNDIVGKSSQNTFFFFFFRLTLISSILLHQQARTHAVRCILKNSCYYFVQIYPKTQFFYFLQALTKKCQRRNITITCF